MKVWYIIENSVCAAIVHSFSKPRKTYECIYTNTFTSKLSRGLDKSSPKLLGQDKPRLELAVGWISREHRFCSIYTGCSRLMQAAAYYPSYNGPIVFSFAWPHRFCLVDSLSDHGEKTDCFGMQDLDAVWNLCENLQQRKLNKNALCYWVACGKPIKFSVANRLRPKKTKWRTHNPDNTYIHD